jgi:hypothetical protein
MWPPWSAFVTTQSTQRSTRGLHTGRQLQRVGQFVEIARRWIHFAGRAHLLKGGARGKRGESRHRAATIGDLYGFALLDQPKQFTCPLAELAHPDGSHVLFVAH